MAVAVNMNTVFTIINLFFITWLSFFGVKGCYRMVTIFPAAVEPIATSVDVQTPTANDVVQPLAAYAAITRRNLFQTQKATEKETLKVDLEGLQQTELSLKLWGTVTRDKEKGAYAVIEDTKERRQDLYREGDTIQNAVLKLILREKVVLTVNGRDEILSMEEKAGAGMAGGQQYAARPPISSSPVTQRITLMRSQIDAAMENVTELMGQVKVRPYFENGQPDGLMLSSVNPQSIFRKMGLRNGDVITGVDGQKIESVDDALKFYESIRSSSGLKLDIKRQGRPRSIEYMIK